MEGPPSLHSPVVLTFAVAAGLTPLIPVPFVDDVAKSLVQRRMVRELAERRGVLLTDSAVRALADDPPSPLATKVAVAVVIYPLKKIFKKTFLVLAGKDAIDTVSQTYHLGYLVELALEKRWHEARSPERIRASITKACKEVGTSPVEKAIGAVYERSRAALVTLARKVRGAEAPATDIQVDVNDAPGFFAELRAALANVPADHFSRLGARVENELGL
jgi:uncharacterized protein (DUF697 family)